MAIKYKLTRVNDNITHNPKPRYKPTILPDKNVTLKEIKKQLQTASSATKGDVSLVMDNFCDIMGDLLKEGHTVSIQGLGTFFPVPGVTKEIENPDFVPPGTVRIKGVAFRPSPELREILSEATFEKVKS